MVKQYRKKPVVIEAIQLTADNFDEVCEFIGMENLADTNNIEHYIGISTLEGVMEARLSDFIIKGIKGEFYPCKQDIFEASYEPVE